MYQLKFLKLPRKIKKLRLIELKKVYSLNQANQLYEQVVEKLEESGGEMKVEIFSKEEAYDFILPIDITRSLSGLVSSDISKDKKEAEEEETSQLEELEHELILEFERESSEVSREAIQQEKRESFFTKVKLVRPFKEKVIEASEDKDSTEEPLTDVEPESDIEDEYDDYVPDYLVEQKQEQDNPVEDKEVLRRTEETNLQPPLYSTREPVEVAKVEPVKNNLPKRLEVERIELHEYIDVSSTKAMNDLQKLVSELRNKVNQDADYMIRKMKLDQSEDFISQKKKEFIKNNYSTSHLEQWIANIEENIATFRQLSIEELSGKFNRVKEIDKAELVEKKIQQFKNEMNVTFEEKRNVILERVAQEFVSEMEMLEARQNEEREGMEQRHSREKVTLENNHSVSLAKVKEDIAKEQEKALSTGIEGIGRNELNVIQKEQNEALISYKALTEEKVSLGSAKIIQSVHDLEQQFFDSFLEKLLSEQESFEKAYEEHKSDLKEKQEQVIRSRELEIEKEKNEIARKQLEKEQELDQKAEANIQEYASMYQKAAYEREAQRFESLQFQNQILEHLAPKNVNPSSEPKKNSKGFVIGLCIASTFAVVGMGGFTYTQVQRYAETNQALWQQNADLESKLEEYISSVDDSSDSSTTYVKLDLAILEGAYGAITREYEALQDEDRESMSDTQKNSVALAYINQGDTEKARQVMK